MDFQKLNKDMGYEPYTQEFDQIVDAEQLLDEAQMSEKLEALSAYRRLYEEYNRDYQKLVTTDLAEELHQSLTDNGLDPSEVTVCFLVDCSGSSRGDTAAHMTMATMDASLALEKLGVETSVLGYTTAQWKGGLSFQKWKSDGRPANPGRLNDLLHIVYKRPDEKAVDKLPQLASMADSAPKRENVDGEALMWAVECLETLDRPKKVIINLTDGFRPTDDATMTYNGNDYLFDHVTAVSMAIEDEKRIVLARTWVNLDDWNLKAYNEIRDSGKFENQIVTLTEKMKDHSPVSTLKAVSSSLKSAISRTADLDVDLQPRLGR